MENFFEFSLEEITNGCRQMLRDKNKLDLVASEILDDMIEVVIMGVVFEEHHGHKTGITKIKEGCPENVDKFVLYDNKNNVKGLDIFGESTEPKPQQCECPNCHRIVGSTNFARHLDSCMGIGNSRSGSRVASQRIAKVFKEPPKYAEMSSSEEDDSCSGKKKKNRGKQMRKIKKGANLT